MLLAVKRSFDFSGLKREVPLLFYFLRMENSIEGKVLSCSVYVHL